MDNPKVGGRVRGPECLIDCAERGFRVSARLFKAGKIVVPEKIFRGSVHSFEIQSGIAAAIGITLHEGVFHPVDKVGVFPSDGVEAGVEFRRSRSYF